MQKLQAIFFDFDGVLIDSTPTKTAGFRKLFAHCSEEDISAVIAYHQLHGGISRVEKIKYTYQYILRKPLSEEQLQREAARYSEIVLEDVIDTPWIEGAQSFLEDYYRKLPMFVISGTPHDELHHIVEARKIGHYFKSVYGSPRKKTELVREVLERWRLKKGNCAFVGDALTDLYAAVETGLHFVGIQGDVQFPGGTLVLPDCTELRQAMARQFVLPG